MFRAKIIPYLSCYHRMASAHDAPPLLESPVADVERLCRAALIPEDGERDIWQDPPAMRLLPLDPDRTSDRKKRISRRIQGYRRDGPQLLKLILNGTVQIVRESKDSIPIATAIH